jgi:hypothetical protein
LVENELAALANRVLVNRGLRWLMRGSSASYPNYSLARLEELSTEYSTDHQLSTCRGNNNNNNNSSGRGSTSTLSKAMYFLMLGEDWGRMAVLTDHALHRCASAVARCSWLQKQHVCLFLPTPSLEPITFILGKPSGPKMRYGIAEYCRYNLLAVSGKLYRTTV